MLRVKANARPFVAPATAKAFALVRETVTVRRRVVRVKVIAHCPREPMVNADFRPAHRQRIPMKSSDSNDRSKRRFATATPTKCEN